MEVIHAFKMSLLQQGTVGILGNPEWAENRSHGGYKSISTRRGSEATQMRIWNQRIAQVIDKVSSTLKHLSETYVHNILLSFNSSMGHRTYQCDADHFHDG